MSSSISDRAVVPAAGSSLGPVATGTGPFVWRLRRSAPSAGPGWLKEASTVGWVVTKRETNEAHGQAGGGGSGRRDQLGPRVGPHPPADPLPPRRRGPPGEDSDRRGGPGAVPGPLPHFAGGGGVRAGSLAHCPQAGGPS